MLSANLYLLEGLIGAKPSPPYNGDNGRVVGGQNAEPNKWKWQVDNCGFHAQLETSVPFEITSSLITIYWVVSPLRFLFSWALMRRGISPTSVGEPSSMPSTSWLQLTASSGWSSRHSLRPPVCNRPDPPGFDAFNWSLPSPSVQTPGNTEWWQVSITWTRMKAVSSSVLWRGLLSIPGGITTLQTGIMTAKW